MTTDGATVASATYEPFGEFASNDGLGATSTFPSFAGTPTDPNSGLLLMGARAYDPSVGRFLTFDPAPVSAYDPAISPYVYVNNRPTVLVDPTGLRGVSTERCAGWLCTVYTLDQVFESASDVFGLLTAGSAVASFVFPPVAVATPLLASATMYTSAGEFVTGVTITLNDAATGGDWACEAGHTAGSLLSAVAANQAADAAWSSLPANRSARTALARAVNASTELGAGSVLDGFIGNCSRPGG